MTAGQTRTNRLIHETSPYLRQHAHNPVDWYPWGPEALEQARRLDRPLFLSIGYSACHWCHVMEHESFENDEIADILNRHFVSVKVDREERPDLDQIYMTAVQAMTQQGGWPMSVFLTPDLKPFHGGTYYPPDDRHGRIGFKRLLLALVEAWKNRRKEIDEVAENVTGHIQGLMRLEPGDGEPTADMLRNAVRYLGRAFDATHGGFGQAPKFPHPMDIRVLLRAARRFEDDDALRMARLTLDKMARGGIYDHLGGGFARYSTDERWLVPHFEKMLYDNALLVPCYLEAFQLTRDDFYREVAEETLGYVLREMTAPEGPFHSTQDADSEGVEGKFYVWTPAEIEDVLGPEMARTFNRVYDVTDEGNWDDPHHPEHSRGKSILNRSRTWEQDAHMLGMSAEELRRQCDAARKKLYEVRSRRVWPGRDDKVLTSWNGLMINALAQAAQVLDRPEYAAAAARAADFLLTRLRTPDGRLLHTWGADSEAKLNGYLEDYAYLLDALVTLYEAEFEPRWIAAALDLAGVMREQFWDEVEGGFFYTGKAHEQLIARTKDPSDNATPSANSVAVLALLRLGRLTGRNELLEPAERTLRVFHDLLAKRPFAAAQMLIALDFYLGPVQELAIVGDPEAEDTRRLLRTVRAQFRPSRVVALERPGDDSTSATVPLLAGKTGGAEVVLYICENFSCREPRQGADAMAAAEKL